MHIDLMRDSATTFRKVADPSQVRSLRVWYCKYKSLAPISSFTNLQELVIGALPDMSIDFLAPIRTLRYLKIVHMPKISEISGLQPLTSLESLSLATSPSWDAARKKTVVYSLDPVASLPQLKHLELFGVCPSNMSLAPLERCKMLRSARFSQYPQEEVERFYELMGISNAYNPPPCFESQA